MTPDEQRQVDEAVAIRLSATIAQGIQQVVAHYQRLEEQEPRFLKYTALHAVGFVLGELMRELQQTDADPARARRFCAELVARLERAAHSGPMQERAN
jgi:hypothetical protein